MSKSRLITPRKLSQIAKNVLDFLENKKIASIEYIEKRQGEFFDIKKQDDITLDLKLSESGTKLYTIIYIDYKTGVPLEIQMDPDLNNSKISVKTGSKLNGYGSFLPISDYFGNILQNKTLDGCSISEIKKELEKLDS